MHTLACETQSTASAQSTARPVAAPLHGVPCLGCSHYSSSAHARPTRGQATTHTRAACGQPTTRRLAAALPSGFSLDQTELLPQYVLEVIRRFAPVSGFAYVERSAGGAPQQTAMLSLHSAQNDPDAWADDPNRFLLRPMEEYAAKSVGFAEPAPGPGSTRTPPRTPPHPRPLRTRVLSPLIPRACRWLAQPLARGTHPRQSGAGPLDSRGQGEVPGLRVGPGAKGRSRG